VAKKFKKQIFRYECTLTNEAFKTTRQAPSPEDLVSVKGYYDIHPEEDDRPEHIKKALEAES